MEGEIEKEYQMESEEEWENQDERMRKLPKKGEKQMMVTEESQIQLTKKRKDWYQSLLITRNQKKKNLSVGVWNESMMRVQMEITKGKHWASIGTIINGKWYLTPEETIYLMDASLLQVFENGLPISLQEAYSLLNKEGKYTMDHYSSYSHLKRLGYAIFRTDWSLSFQESQSKNLNNEQVSNLNHSKHREWWPASDVVIPTYNFQIEIMKEKKIHYSDTKLFKIQTFPEIPIVEENEKYFLAFDVYQPQTFQRKKKSRTQPTWRLCVCK